MTDEARRHEWPTRIDASPVAWANGQPAAGPAEPPDGDLRPHPNGAPIEDVTADPGSGLDGDVTADPRSGPDGGVPGEPGGEPAGPAADGRRQHSGATLTRSAPTRGADIRQPGNAPGNAPGSTPGSTPGNAPGDAPADAPADAPGDAVTRSAAGAPNPAERGRALVDAPAQATRRSSPGPLDFRHWGIRPKLTALLLIPTVIALVLGTLHLKAALSSAAAYARLETLAAAARDATALVHGLEHERDLSAGSPSQRRSSQAQLAHDPAEVDAAAARLRATLTRLDGLGGPRGPALQARVRTAIGGLDRLPGLRQSASSGIAAPPAIYGDYTAVISSLLALAGETAAHASAGHVANQVFALEAMAAGKESVSRLRATVYAALLAGTLDTAARTELVTARGQQASALGGYLAHASAAQQERYRSGVNSAEVARIDAVVASALAGRPPSAWGVTATQWFELASRHVDQLRQVEGAQVRDITTAARSLASGARTGALVAALVLGLILVFAGLAVALVARSVVRPLRTLRSTALGVAHRDLPETVRRLQQGPDADVDLTIDPVPISTRDEIGEVARAFDAVHGEAVRLAGEQALLRSNVNAMFVNLARRSQALVERQLRLIDDLESSEQDPDRLANLFQLDHLATRMRRNDENLLVLAGAPAGRRRNEPVPLVDVVRAASAEVEQYARVQIDIQSGYELISPAVNDTVHLLAELLENATAFSPPHTPVRAQAVGLGSKGEVLVEIEDEGIGMSPEELAKANEKLASLEDANVATSRMMGLFVVARLAQRQGIQVRLRGSQYGGVTALVRLPAEIIRRPAADPEPTGPRHRLIPEQPSGPPQPVPATGAGKAANGANGANGAKGARGAQTAKTAQTAESGASTDAGPHFMDLTGGFPLDPAAAPVSDEPEQSPIFDALQSEWFRPVLPPTPMGTPDPAAAGRLPAARASDSPFHATFDSAARSLDDVLDGPLAGSLTGSLEPFAPPLDEPPARPLDEAPARPLDEAPARPLDEAVAGPTLGQPLAQPSTGWTSAGDEGWRAVAALGAQPAGGLTAAGLPVRIPGRNLVPGSAAPSPSAGRVPSHRDPEAARLLSSYQQGIGRARAVADTTGTDAAGAGPAGADAAGAGADRADRQAPDVPEDQA
jgi:signal transduction histidine kinase